MIKISHLNFSYQDQEVLKDINLDYTSSSFLGIIGRNGGGKSTLLKLILGLLDTNSSITRNLPLSHIGYVPQYLLCNSNFPICVFDLVLMGCTKPFGLYSKEDKQKAKEALERLDILNLVHHRFESLSGGQKQKVLLARALCANSKLLILDEPTANIDLHSTIEIFELLKKLHQKGIGIIVVCHDLEILLTYATQIAYVQKTLSLFSIPQEREELLEHFGCKHHIRGNCDA